MIIVSTLFLLKTDYKCVKLFSNVCKNRKNDNYHNVWQLLLLMINASIKNCLISRVHNIEREDS